MMRIYIVSCGMLKYERVVFVQNAMFSSFNCSTFDRFYVLKYPSFNSIHFQPLNINEIFWI